MMVRPLSRRCMFSLCFFVLLVAFGHAEEVERLIARAKQAEQGGQLDAAAEKDPDFQRLKIDPDFRAMTRQRSSGDHGDDEHE